MKMAFLFQREILPELKKDGRVEEADLPEYFAWKFGPFSVQFLNDLEFLVNRQFVSANISSTNLLLEETAEYEYWVEEMPEEDSSTLYEDVFSLSEASGVPKALEIWQELSQQQQKVVSKFKAALNGAPLSRILEYVYRNYEAEGLTKKSLIKDKYIP